MRILLNCRSWPFSHMAIAEALICYWPIAAGAQLQNRQFGPSAVFIHRSIR